MDKKIKPALLFILFLAICIFVTGVITKLKAPLAEWDHYCLSYSMDWAKSINSPWFLDHTPGYSIFLAAVFKIFGISVRIARLANIFCIIVTIFLIYFLTKKTFNKNSAIWASIIYLISPIVIQGSMLMDYADTSLLPLAFTLFFFSVVNANRESKSVTDIIAIGLAIALCFWSKITSSIALVASLILYLIFNYKNFRKYHVKILIGILIGIIVFFTTWTVVAIPLILSRRPGLSSMLLL